MAVKDYRELIVWQKAMDLVEQVYHHTGRFPKEEVYGLSSQLRRAAVSIPSNIAEGNARTTTRDFLHFLSIAYGSIKEVETQILIAERLGYDMQKLTPKLLESTNEVARLISGLSNSLKRKLES
ncbi:MAG: four helix bundle protein [Pirellulales bacterium]|nr:four helix bundle protein [Pirellulales bacterium]